MVYHLPLLACNSGCVYPISGQIHFSSDSVWLSHLGQIHVMIQFDCLIDWFILPAFGHSHFYVRSLWLSNGSSASLHFWSLLPAQLWQHKWKTLLSWWFVMYLLILFFMPILFSWQINQMNQMNQWISFVWDIWRGGNRSCRVASAPIASSQCCRGNNIFKGDCSARARRYLTKLFTLWLFNIAMENHNF